MLPFLKNAQETSGGSTSDGDDEFDSLHFAAEDMLSAIHARDAKALASAIRAAFDLCDGAPHYEGMHNG
jgi:hypothetical protein